MKFTIVCHPQISAPAFSWRVGVV